MAFLIRLSGLLLCLCCGLAGSAYADDLRLAERKIKAGLLYNFIKHTVWPSTEGSAAAQGMEVCVYGDSAFAEVLQPMHGRTANQRMLNLHPIRRVEEASHCHVLFVGAEGKKDWPELRKVLEGRQVLTVSDSSGFTSNGGMVEFREIEHRIGAVFNLDALAGAGLQVSDTLLGLSGVETTGGASR